MTTLRFFRYAPLLVAALAACGGISDPTKSGAEKVQTVSGALTGGASAPAGAHIALVWRNATTSSLVVGADVPIVDGKFTMNLTEPPDAYFFNADDGVSAVGGAVDAPPDTAVPEPAPASGGSAPSGGAGGVKTLSNVSGGITGAFEVAVAGFVVYVDANGNGQLDVSGATAQSPDQIVGGNSEIFLTYLRGGGQLDLEKLRDSSGILPTIGFDLAWKKGRWLPLNEVELKITSSVSLPSSVCSGGSATTVDAPVARTSTDTAGSSGSSGPSSDAGVYYPSPTDPNLQCAPDGRSFTMTSNCPPPPPPGLCSSDISYGCAGGASSYLPPGEPVPEGWPCPITKDGGIDGGSFDASTDAGSASDAGF